MARPLPPDGLYAGRSPHIAILNVSIPRRAKELLQSWATSPKSLGDAVTELVYREEGRREERERLRKALEALDAAEEKST